MNVKNMYMVTAAAVAASALALSGCASDNATDTAVSAIGEPGATDISGTVTFWHAYSADSPEVATLDDVIIPAFEDKFPEVDVKSVPVPYDDLHQKLITAVAGDQLPDLVRADIGWVPELAELGVLVPLSEEMPDFQEIADNTYPGSLATNKWKDAYFGLPLDTNTRVLLYNSDALEAAGVEVPTTVDELLDAAPALKDSGAFAFADNGASGWNVLPWIWSAGGDIVNDDVTKASGYINSPESIEGVQTLVDLYEQGYLPDILLGDTGGLATSDGLAQGAYSAILDGPWMYPIFASQYPDFELQAAQVPAGAGGSISVVGGEDIVLTQSSENKAAAAEFLRYLLSEESQLAMAEVGQMSVLKSLGDKLADVNEYYTPFVEQLATAKPRPVTPAWSKIDAILQDEIRAAVSGDKTVKDALDAVAVEADALLAQYK
ncbi:extracellular solute-binding protein [Salinibacterium sp. ZJ450]|uniref:extracellular solute-binding protein n=1 Tax=Salinibacterium sp. ZJ450 TaxID=2708338 RepID=UPI00174D0C8F|nr:extracellular solute-binding protein [Salinibacterium sp. ZJ450]